MVGLPAGVVTFLFTDIEGSTPLWEAHPEAMGRAVELHDRELRSAIEGSGGTVFKTVGDAFCAAFVGVDDALSAAFAARRAIAGIDWGQTPILVRAGLHSGASEPRGFDYFGPAVNRAARVCGAAHGGQILLSSASNSLLSARARAGASLRDLGSHRLKGIAAPERLFQADPVGEGRDFPPLAAAEGNPTNLPAETTSFVGREREKSEILRSVAGSRLTTIVGPGGVGKTRLAREASRAALGEFADGVWFVQLSSARNGEQAGKAVLEAVRAEETSNLSLDASLATALAAKDALLVLDNCEHLIDRCAAIASVLLREAPSLRILATSREPLRVAGESVYRLAPLGASAALSLLADRSRLARGGRGIPPEDEAAAQSICSSLDGIPLALELAAARTSTLGFREIEARIGSMPGGAVSFLRGGDRTAEPRQRGLRQLMDWSWELLGEGERRVLATLSVLAGPIELGSAERLCGRGSLDAIESLADKSLVSTAEAGGWTRLSLLSTVRDYAAERLEEYGLAGAARESLVALFRDWAAGMSRRLFGPEGRTILRAMVEERANLAAALDDAAKADDPRELEILAEIGLPCLHASEFALLKAHLEVAIARSDSRGSDDRELRSLAFECAARLELRQGRLAEADALAARSLEEARASGEPRRAAGAICLLADFSRNTSMTAALGSSDPVRRDFSGAAARYAEAENIYRSLGCREGMVQAAAGRGICTILFCDFAAATDILVGARRLASEIGDDVDRAWIDAALSRALSSGGDAARARAVAHEGLALADDLGASYCRYVLQFSLGIAERAEGRLREAERLFLEMESYGRSSASPRLIRTALVNLLPVLGELGRVEELERRFTLLEEDPLIAVGGSFRKGALLNAAAPALALRGDAAGAAFCLGAAGVLEGAYSDAGDEAWFDRISAALRGMLGAEGFERAFAEGRAAGPEAGLRRAGSRYPSLARAAESALF